jgi:hypothetical protein
MIRKAYARARNGGGPYMYCRRRTETGKVYVNGNELTLMMPCLY